MGDFPFTSVVESTDSPSSYRTDEHNRPLRIRTKSIFFFDYHPFIGGFCYKA
jgi:hypothetical protein